MLFHKLLPQRKAAPLGDFSLPFVKGELLVKGAIPLTTLSTLNAKPQNKNLPRGWHLIRVPDGSEHETAIALLQAGAIAVEPNYLLQPVLQPNDTLYPHQVPYMENLLHLEESWSISAGSSELRIAVLDTGYLDHPDLTDRILEPLPSAKLDTANEDIDPTDDTAGSAFGHGTAVAGIIGATTNNGQGIAGVTWSGPILPIKVFAAGTDTATEADIAEAILVAKELRVRLVNMSFGFSGTSNVIEDALQEGYKAGTAYLAASGNSGVSDVYYPAKSPYTLAVGAIDINKQLAWFSNYGPELDVVAPGTNITILHKEGSNYNYMRGDGTSFATPIAAGVAALYMTAYKKKFGTWPNPARVYACLKETAEDLGIKGRDNYYGFGLVRPDRILLTIPSP